MTSEITAKKDIQKLQRAIVDGLEDVKGQDIVVFNTETMSPLFERVIIASGTSNRQTKALAASVRDAVREAGFDKPRIEGEDNGEWIIVDCGQAVAHVMQPVIRQYYRLEDIWGAKPVRLKSAAERAAEARADAVTAGAQTSPAKKTTRTPRKTEDKAVKPVDAKSLARKQAKAAAVAATAQAPAKKAAARPAVKPSAGKAVAAKAPARRSATGSAQAKPAIKTVVVKPKAVASKAGAQPAAKSAVKRATGPSAGKAAARPAAKKKA
jgi:ribosome-associated protein